MTILSTHIKAHSTRAYASSLAYIQRVSPSELCQVICGPVLQCLLSSTGQTWQKPVICHQRFCKVPLSKYVLFSFVWMFISYVTIFSQDLLICILFLIWFLDYVPVGLFVNHSWLLPDDDIVYILMFVLFDVLFHSDKSMCYNSYSAFLTWLISFRYQVIVTPIGGYVFKHQ